MSPNTPSEIIASIGIKENDTMQAINELKSNLNDYKEEQINSLIDYYSTNHNDSVDLAEMYKVFTFPQALRLLAGIAENREVRAEEFFNSDLMYFLESRNGEHKEVVSYLKTIFESFSETNKLHLATTCFGYTDFAKIYSFLMDWLEEEFPAVKQILSLPINTYANSLKLEDYDRETKSTELILRMMKDNYIGMKELVFSITKLFKLGHKNNRILIHSYRFKSWSQLTPDGSIVTIDRSGEGIEPETLFEGKGETQAEKIESCIKFVADNMWYFTNP